MGKLLTVFIIGILFQASGWAGAQRAQFTVFCAPENDLYKLLTDAGCKLQRSRSPAEAIASAANVSTVLLLADQYPTNTVTLSMEDYANARAKKLRLYVEFPSCAPGITLGPPRKTTWERLVVNSDRFGPTLPKLRLMMANECFLQPATGANAMLVAARVAGYDTAVYGLPEVTHPVLISLDEDRILIATTKLSGFITGRFAPNRDWAALWACLLGRLSENKVPELQWKPRVTASYGPLEKLPRKAELRAVRAAAQWIRDSGTLVHADDFGTLSETIRQGVETIERCNKTHLPGDGTCGILEGYSSAIRHDGSQAQRSVIRADCQAESAMMLSLNSVLNRDKAGGSIASNLLDFLYYKSDMCGGGRGNPKHPAFGLVGWGGIAPAWLVANYSDDGARVMLATILASTALKTDRWDEPLLKALFANLRITGKRGFQGDRVDMPALEKHGWRYFGERDSINYSPHFESYMWACYLWAYRSTGETEFLDKARSGIRILMEAYPDKWRWDDSTERARMLLCLAWLVRVEDTPEHRRWLLTVVEDILATQNKTGALPDRFRGAEASHYQIPKSNEAYGTGESPLLQFNGDPVTDQLYHSGFVLLGLHEAAAALNDPGIRAAEHKLVQYLCRIQTRSEDLPYLSGTWFRAFDFNRWEPWASSGDSGWGAWSLETGWAQAWTVGVLGLRLKDSSFWDITAGKNLRQRVPAVRQLMSQNSGQPWNGNN